MIAYITSFLSIITCLLAWFLGVFSKLSDLKLQEKRKLNLLIYNLLELKFWVDKEVLLDNKLTELLDMHWKERNSGYGKEEKIMRGTLLKRLKESFRGAVEIPALDGSIEQLVKELAEVDPIFAFELNGKYQISSQLKKGTQLMGGFVENEKQGCLPEGMVDLVLRPKLLCDLQEELSLNLPFIAKKAGNKFYRQYRKLNIPQSVEVDEKRVADHLSKFLRQLTVSEMNANTVLENK